MGSGNSKTTFKEFAPETIADLLPLYEKIPSRLGFAVLCSYLGYKYEIVILLRRLNRSTAAYLKKNETMLDQFWVMAEPVKYNEVFHGNKCGDNIYDKYCIESMYPALETVVPLGYQVNTLYFDDYGTTIFSLRTRMNDGFLTP